MPEPHTTGWLSVPKWWRSCTRASALHAGASLPTVLAVAATPGLFGAEMMPLAGMTRSSALSSQ